VQQALSWCGIKYATIKQMDKLNSNLYRPRKDKLHSELHYIAEQMWEYWNKKESFAMFLGILKRKGTSWGYKALSEMKDYENKNGKKMPIKIFMAAGRKK
jgi:hypothetical protein